MNPVVDISGLSIRGFARTDIARFVRRCLKALHNEKAVAFEVSEISIVFVDDREMIRLNTTYRGKRRATDVLTFEGDPEDAPPGSSARPLGEIIISVERAKAQAKHEKHSLSVEIRYLILHGIIHALGFDHESDDGEMNSLEGLTRDAVGLS